MAIKSFDEIDWKRNEHVSPEGKETVRILCSVAEVMEWVKQDNGKFLPSRYTMDDLRLTFSPEWGHYEIEGIKLRLPQHGSEVIAAATFVGHLLAFGYQRPLEEGEARLFGYCPTCSWRDNMIFVVEDEEREWAYTTLEELHDQTDCKEKPHLTETSQ